MHAVAMFVCGIEERRRDCEVRLAYVGAVCALVSGQSNISSGAYARIVVCVSAANFNRTMRLLL